MHIKIQSTTRKEMVDITARVQEVVTASGMRSGLCHIFVPHTTAAITLNENADPDVQEDMNRTLSRLIPVDPDYRHMEGNSDAHMKASLIGASEVLAVRDGRLDLGRWQAIYFWEFDGPRKREVRILLLPQQERGF
ncbi:secondary thiamine-phosphate synthase enzyme YjbQ [Desulfobotulus sp.]|jgi:secondary thiamine-phosphate synthase enzyme|uniref:secondary thiamine-phosphate synthase enzyme YjbQ n=1 Tax=Desulfobotulus sp. TaxID=1940337 RepID=UPI002A36A397|nr:secondary thiamine-phosphate synthase enzyme YjbQ [Desulfobotulus sp.]MDY0164149.1 secondary thiamine-phosphate synthase enzyme YjbQ [Desulfobotulus sp.]